MPDRRYGSDTLGGEYPERYSPWNDERGNKLIINKSDKVNSIEQRMADGTLTNFNSNDNLYEFNDHQGTFIRIDRKKQEALIKFAGCKITINKGKFILEGEQIVIQGTKYTSIIGKISISIMSPIINMLSKFVGQISKQNQEPY